MLVSIALTAPTVYMVRACTKCLDETQWSKTRNKIYWAETETCCSETETRPETLRILSEMKARQYVSTPRDRLETETSRSRPHPWSTLTSTIQCWSLQQTKVGTYSEDKKE